MRLAKLRYTWRMADNTTVFNAADDYERFMGRWSRAIGGKACKP